MDRIGAVAVVSRMPLLEPNPGPPERCATSGIGLQLRQSVFGQRSQIVAHHEGEYPERDAQRGQQPQCASRAQTTGAQDGELRRLRHARQRIDRSDQDRDRSQLVQVRRNLEKTRCRCNQARVAATRCLGNGIDEVDEEKQRQECQSHEGDRRDDIDIEEASDGFHGAVPAAAKVVSNNIETPFKSARLWTSDTSLHRPNPCRS